jgi:diguanylate cyclase (GGDEF)-like protein
VLKSLANIFKEELRNVDIVGRLGGEEFGIILPETGIGMAVEVAERLREVISTTEVSLPMQIQIYFSVSIGIASLVDKKMNIDMLLNESDKALYRAKQAGRNNVHV